MKQQTTNSKKEPSRFIAFLKHPFIRKNEPMLHTVEWIFILLAFFSVSFPVVYYQSGKNIFEEGKLNFIGGKVNSEILPSEAEKKFIGETIAEEPIDTTDWDIYQNKWYGFEIHHPNSWTNNTQYKTATEKSAHYEIIYKFRKDGESAADVFTGYDVKIYPAKKVADIKGTNEIHKKEGVSEDTENCELITEENFFYSEEMSFQKVSIKEDDPCFKPAYFYSIKKGDYIYNVVPVVGDSGERFADPEKETNKIFPEFKEAITSFKFIPISRPAATPAKPKITAKRPVAAKVVNGKLVCAKKNDKPRKSKQNKPGHLDLECCLDPDERPNPWCTY